MTERRERSLDGAETRIRSGALQTGETAVRVVLCRRDGRVETGHRSAAVDDQDRLFVLVAGVISVVVFLIVDLMYVAIDPRVRL